MMKNNSSELDVLFPGESPWHILITTFIMIMLIVTTVIGNVFVIVAVFYHKPLRIVPNFFIVSLATADLLVALIVMPFHVSNNIAIKWLYGSVFCDLWLTFDVLLCTASILNICVIALDRYWAIHDPINYAQKRTVKRVLIMILFAWLASAIISVPPVLGWNEIDNGMLFDQVNSECTLTSQKGYVLYSACGSFYIPLCVMSFVYLKIYLATKKRLRERCRAAVATRMAVMSAAAAAAKTSTSTEDEDEENTNCKPALTNETPDKRSADNNRHTIRKRKSILNFFEEKQRISLSKERKAARTLAIIMITFVLCWIPFFLMYIILPFCDSCVHPGKWVEMLFVWLGYVNSSLNPAIYTVFNTEFRKAFKYIFSCGKSRRGVNGCTRTFV